MLGTRSVFRVASQAVQQQARTITFVSHNSSFLPFNTLSTVQPTTSSQSSSRITPLTDITTLLESMTLSAMKGNNETTITEIDYSK